LGVAGDQSDDLADAEQTKRSGVRVAPASSSSRLVLAKREVVGDNYLGRLTTTILAGFCTGAGPVLEVGLS